MIGLKNQFLVYFLCAKFPTYSWNIVLGNHREENDAESKITNPNFLSLVLKKKVCFQNVVVNSMDFRYVWGTLHNICVLQYFYLKNWENSLILYLYILCQLNKLIRVGSLEQCRIRGKSALTELFIALIHFMASRPWRMYICND